MLHRTVLNIAIRISIHMDLCIDDMGTIWFNRIVHTHIYINM